MTILDNAFIDEYSGYVPSPKLYPAIRAIARMQSIYAWRMMYLLHRLTSEDISYPDRLSLPVPPLAKALRVEEEDLVGVLLDTVQRISENPVQEAQRKEAGTAEAWLIEPWIHEAVIDETNQLLRLRLNRSASDFMISLRVLASVRPETCVRLSRGYPTWMYVILSNATRLGDYWCIPLSTYNRLSHLTAFNSRDSIFVETEYKKNFQTLGLKISPELLEEERIARKEKRPIHFRAMLLASGGNLLTVRQKSELLVNVCQIKGLLGYHKRSVSHLAFSFREEDELVSYGSDRSIFEKDSTFAQEIDTVDLTTLLY